MPWPNDPTEENIAEEIGINARAPVAAVVPVAAVEEAPPVEGEEPPRRAIHRPNLAPILGRLLALATSIALALGDGKITIAEGQRIARRARRVALELGALLDPEE
jgi:hypothetical protein